MKRIKNNDLLPWFTQDHETLPASYLKSCREFFDWLDRCEREGFQAPSLPQLKDKHGPRKDNYEN